VTDDASGGTDQIVCTHKHQTGCFTWTTKWLAGWLKIPHVQCIFSSKHSVRQQLQGSRAKSTTYISEGRRSAAALSGTRLV